MNTSMISTTITIMDILKLILLVIIKVAMVMA